MNANSSNPKKHNGFPAPSGTETALEDSVELNVPGGTGQAESVMPTFVGQGDRYQIKELLGTGGSAVVYRAKDTKLGREVAIKFLIRTESEDGRKLDRTVSEAQALATLDHQNIVKVYDVVTSGPMSPYIVCEIGPETTLADFVAEHGAFTATKALPFITQICAALKHAHGRGIVHGDLKPANILVDSERGALITDFGLAASGQSREGRGGTQGFSAPEAFTAGRLDPTADIYSLGGFLYYMLTATVPTSLVTGLLPPAIDCVITRARNERQSERYSTPDAFLSAYNDALQSVTEAWQERESTLIPFEALSEALQVLEAGSTLSQHELVPKAELESLKNRFARLEAGRHDLPRIVLCGEFKAGKSTLVNAMVGQHVAAVDVLEMTACISEFFPSRRSDDCRIVLADGGSQTMKLEEFLAVCKERRLQSHFKQDISRIEIGIAADFPFVLVDTPGIGSTTVANEKVFLTAQSDADIMLWVIDINSLGSTRDFLFIDQAREAGLPIWIALAQVDVVGDEAQVTEARQYLADEYRVPLDRIYPLAALQGANETGVVKLRDSLADITERKGAELRKQAQRGHAIQLANDLQAALGVLLTGIEKHDHTIRRIETELDGIAAEAKAIVAGALRDAARTRFLLPFEKDLVAAMSAPLAKGSTLTKQQIDAIFHRIVPASYFSEFWSSELKSACQGLENCWREQIKDATPRISASFKMEQNLLLGKVGDFVTTGTLSHAVTDEVGAAFKEHAKPGLAIAGVATAYAAWLGPSASAVSIGAAATGVGLPVAAIVVGVMYAINKIKKSRNASAEMNDYAKQIIDSLRGQSESSVVEQYMLPKIDELNLGVISSVVQAYCKSEYGGFDPQALRATRNLALSCVNDLRGLEPVGKA